MSIMEHVVDTPQLPGWFAALPAGRKLLAEREAQVAAQRRAAIAEIGTARAAAREQRPALDDAVLTAKGAVDKALVALREAEARSWAAQAAASAPQRNLEAVSRKHARLLNTTAPAAIGAFIVEVQQQTADLLQRGVSERPELLMRRDEQQICGPRVKHVSSNRAGWELVHLALRDALAAARSLHDRVATEADAQAEIEALRGSIPWGKLTEMVDA